ncbi:NAD(P)/FAD-dependent oxidoreductase [Pontivivens nitratireducens]|uniref:NAD(P)/FAD-dependent oxidoreductase n=1 Tax=Pontivivens nitratireducens TaxID=2758038 RepID=UPI001639A67D|nr:FAD-binding oxidoreductase [Pontibrevibacter nitratireducens]
MIEPPGLWRDTCAEHVDSTPLMGDVTTDVAVIGGGFTGLSTALHLAEAGCDVHLLEASAIGSGASGRNVGLVNAGLWLSPQKIRARLGAQIGGRLVEELGQAPRLVFDLIERHQIQCEATRAGTIHVAQTPRQCADLRERAEMWQELGAPVTLLDAQQTAERTGSASFIGGLFDGRAGTVQPLGYARGLARAALGAGAMISNHSRVRAITRDPDGSWHLHTAQGSLDARRIVIATNAQTGDLWPRLDRCQSRIDYFQLASQPLGDRAAHILPAGEGIWNCGTIMISLRRDQAGRIILGSMGRLVETARLSERWASRTLARLLPDLGPVEWQSAWHGTIGTTPDKLPRIVQLDRDVFAPFGYNGRGIAPGTAFGMGLARLLTGTGSCALPLSAPQPLRAPRTYARALDAALLARKAFGTMF